MDRLMRLLTEKAAERRLFVTIAATPAGELEIHLFDKRAAGHPVEGSDLELAYGRGESLEECAEIALRMLEKVESL